MGLHAAESQGALQRLLARQIVMIDADTPLPTRGGEAICALLSGWAIGYRRVGRARQIFALFLPGDLCSAGLFAPDAAVETGRCLTRSVVACVSRDELAALAERFPDLEQALWASELTALAIRRQWASYFSARTAEQRIACLLCDTVVRLRTADDAAARRHEFPLTHKHIADICGLAQGHVQRVLRQFARERLVRLARRKLFLIDEARLQSIGGFDASYLQVEDAGAD
ncbi:Crp/Fnr family transcriptional regulator [Sphingopyxis terrae]|nr:Crp/Fnr family transcriptional regulator [Sphingopyxis terrae]PCF91335.1 Crp/Fnr family transcriptional regulator [Sphingopyxis terrae subsp. ummariensis]